MKKILMLCCALLVVVIAGCSNEAHPEELVGRWQNVANPEFIIDIDESGNIHGVTEDDEILSWKVSRNVLTFTQPDSGEAHSAWKYEIAEDRLIIQAVDREGDLLTNPDGTAMIQFEFEKDSNS